MPQILPPAFPSPTPPWASGTVSSPQQSRIREGILPPHHPQSWENWGPIQPHIPLSA